MTLSPEGDVALWLFDGEASRTLGAVNVVTSMATGRGGVPCGAHDPDRANIGLEPIG